MPGLNEIHITKNWVDDSSVWLREFTHPFLNHDTSTRTGVYPVESMVAFYLPCSFLDNPKIGEIAAKTLNQGPYLYNLDQKSDFAEYEKLDIAAKPYRGAEIAGAIFWAIRDKMDHAMADRLFVSAWFAYLRSSGNADMLEFLKIYRKQFEAEALAKYKIDVERIWADHHVPF